MLGQRPRRLKITLVLCHQLAMGGDIFGRIGEGIFGRVAGAKAATTAKDAGPIA